MNRLLTLRIFEGNFAFEAEAERPAPAGNQPREPIFEALRNLQEEDILFLEEVHPVEIDNCLRILEAAGELPLEAAEYFGFRTEAEREESSAIRTEQALALAKAWREFLKSF